MRAFLSAATATALLLLGPGCSGAPREEDGGTGGDRTSGTSSSVGSTSSGGSTGSGGTSGSRGATSTGGGATGGTSTSGGASGSGGAGSGTGDIFNPPYILGADISWTLEQESLGRSYRDEGQTRSIERILVDQGFNFVRLRTFVCPDCPGGYTSELYSGARPTEAFCDTAHTIAMAKRVKACGMGVFLDFHMSDTWASIGHQNVPSAWAGMNPSQMQEAAYDHIKGVLDEMVAAGVKPDMVQVGNETNSRMSGVSMSNWASFSGLVNAGIRAVRETDPNIIVWAQHGRPRPDGNFRPWVDAHLTNDPPIDVDGICGSTYGTTNNGQDWREEFGYIINTHNLPVMSCEYTDNRRDLINSIMREFPNKMGRGTFLWEPTQYGDRKLFDFSNSAYTTNDNMDAYARLAESYGLPVPSTPAAELQGTTCQ
ncbi:glycosyl hydrolase 53 family protein [Sorangium sp. So ce1389]|uniref:glycosyl hydrolase 53 family protein n=1 Tax=Sorangium sp. So ce1389 TaxID=3133336 RepID=UPI003F61DB98